MKFDTKLVTSTDWVTYPILTIPDAPALDIALIDRPSEPPMGVGERRFRPLVAKPALPASKRLVMLARSGLNPDGFKSSRLLRVIRQSPLFRIISA